MIDEVFNPKPRFEGMQKPGTVYLQTITYNDASVTYSSPNHVYSGTPSQDGIDHVHHMDIFNPKPLISSIQT